MIEQNYVQIKTDKVSAKYENTSRNVHTSIHLVKIILLTKHIASKTCFE